MKTEDIMKNLTNQFSDTIEPKHFSHDDLFVYIKRDPLDFFPHSFLFRLFLYANTNKFRIMFSAEENVPVIVIKNNTNEKAD